MSAGFGEHGGAKPVNNKISLSLGRLREIQNTEIVTHFYDDKIRDKTALYLSKD